MALVIYILIVDILLNMLLISTVTGNKITENTTRT